MKFLIFLLFAFPLVSHAQSKCGNLKKYQLALSIHASNWTNSVTTRTPEGGPYKIKRLLCSPTCKIINEIKIFEKYEPDHPDANKDGYVTYPDIDKEKERAAISTYAKALKLIASKCSDNVELISNNSSFSAEYKSGDIKLDIFNFTKDEKVVSWVREDKEGHSHILNF